MLASLLATFGYPFVFLGTLVEGEMVLIIAGFAAYLGYLDFRLVILLGWLGSMAGDQIFFLLGRYRVQSFLRRFPRLLHKLARVYRLLEKYDRWVLIGFRFVYGFRIITPLALGSSKVSWKEFFICNAIGAFIWSVLFTTGGYLFGNALSLLFTDIQRLEREAIVFVLIVGISLWCISRLMSRMKKIRRKVLSNGHR